VNVFAAYVIRLVAYAFVLGVADRIAEHFWVDRGLDAVLFLAPAHAIAGTILMLAPIGLALAGGARLTPWAVGLAGYLVGAALTAPIILALLAT
jgi:hypothetical protein